MFFFNEGFPNRAIWANPKNQKIFFLDVIFQLFRHIFGLSDTQYWMSILYMTMALKVHWSQYNSILPLKNDDLFVSVDMIRVYFTIFVIIKGRISQECEETFMSPRPRPDFKQWGTFRTVNLTSLLLVYVFRIHLLCKVIICTLKETK